MGMSFEPEMKIGRNNGVVAGSGVTDLKSEILFDPNPEQ